MDLDNKMVFMVLFQAGTLLTPRRVPKSWLWFLLVALTQLGFAAGNGLQNPKFRNFTVNEGLSQSTISAIHQDRYGFLWIGTEDGLNRFDGYRFEAFYHDPNDEHSLSSSNISTLFEDSAGSLWVGTKNGLNRYDQEGTQFVRFQHDPAIPGTLSENHITTIGEDRSGNLWVGTYGGGLCRLAPGNSSFHVFSQDENLPTSLLDNRIWSLYFDAGDTLWIGTSRGLCRLKNASSWKPENSARFSYGLNDTDPRLNVAGLRIRKIIEDRHHVIWIGTFDDGLFRLTPTAQSESKKSDFIIKHFPANSELGGQLANSRVMDILEDEDDHLWLATDGGGLHLLDRETDTFRIFQQHPGVTDSLSSNRLWTLFQDRSGLLWIGSFVAGLNRLNLKSQQFFHLQTSTKPGQGLTDPYVKAITQDSKGHLWIGTSKGLEKMEPTFKVNGHPQFSDAIYSTITLPDTGADESARSVRAIQEDSEGALWLGTWGQGLFRYDPESDEFEVFRRDVSKKRSVSHDMVRCMLLDRYGNLWIGTSRGLNRFNPVNRDFDSFHPSQITESVDSDRIASIYEDRDGNLWLGTNDGLLQYRPQQREIVHFQANPGNPDHLSHNRVRPIYQDLRGDLWIGTFGGGLNRLDLNTEKFERITEREGLPNNVIYGILADAEEQLWLSTNKGLCMLDPVTRNIRTYAVGDGLQSNEFNLGASYQNSAGYMFFGGVNGISVFNPADIEINDIIPPVVITDFKVAGNPLPNSQSIHRLESLQVSLTDGPFTFHVATLDFADPDRNTFSYRMEGLEEVWNTPSSTHQIAYSNLKAGSYTFRVRGANKDGIWNEEGAALRLDVVPPWYLSRLAFFLYVAGFILVMAAIVRIYTGIRIRKQEKLLFAKQKELEDEQRIAEQLRHVDRLKDRFLANTSHELRTPLNGIIGLVGSLIDGVSGNLPDKTVANLKMVMVSARRLFDLVTNLLNYSELHQGEVVLTLGPLDLRSTVDRAISRSSIQNDQRVALINQISPGLPLVNADEDRLQQILANLLGNALKYTREGTISIEAEQAERNITVTVTDTGSGIAEEHLPTIFDSFEKGNDEDTLKPGGSGVGLTIVKELVALHEGEVWAKSRLGEGSSFSFTLPYYTGKATVKPIQDYPLVESATPQQAEPMPEIVAPNPQTQTLNPESFHILVVDDDLINIQVLYNLLSMGGYKVTKASDGEEALALFADQHFDLMVLDIMMPGIDGYQVCRTLRKTHSAKEFPVIMLTAKDQMADMAAGFAAGANDYLTKPVTREELIPRIRTHLHILEMSRDLANARKEAQKGLVAEVQIHTATSTLHNVGNILTSLNISCRQLLEALESSKVHRLDRASKMLERHVDNIVDFLSHHPRGKLLPEYFQQIGGRLVEENQILTKEVVEMGKKSQLMQEIIQTQQDQALSKNQPQVLELNHLVEEVIDMQREFLIQGEVNIQFAPAGHPLPIIAIRIHTIQVLVNILKNAAEAMTSQPEDSRQLRIETEAQGEIARLRVIDTGLGMTAEELANLFQHGYTTKRRGHGFGLHYCQNVMRDMGGHITAHSEGKHKGAVFTLVFRLAH